MPCAMQSSASWWIVCGLAYRSLGIIYGDIGTSPLCERQLVAILPHPFETCI